MSEYKNIIYLKNVLPIGGVETFVYEMAKKYHKEYEIVLFYDTADDQQIKRLEPYIRCCKFNRNRRYSCDTFITNYDIDMIDYVDANEYIEVIHANFMIQKNFEPHIHEKINKYIAVSKSNAYAWFERTNIECEVCANPLTYEKQEYRPLFLLAAQRLSPEKGVERIIQLTEQLDVDPEIKYYMIVCTNQKTSTYPANVFKSKNVAVMSDNTDIRHLISACDVFINVPSSAGRDYSTAEKLASGHGKLMVTPLTVFKEMGTNRFNTITLERDCSNIKNVVEELRRIYKSQRLPQTFTPVEVNDEWSKYLTKGAGNYVYVPKRYVQCKATDEWQKRHILLAESGIEPKPNEILTLSEERYAELHDDQIYHCCFVTDKKYL